MEEVCINSSWLPTALTLPLSSTMIISASWTELIRWAMISLVVPGISSAKAFREEIPGTTKLIIAQRISSVQDADMIIVLDNGMVADVGNHQELLERSTIYQEVYYSQQKGGEE